MEIEERFTAVSRHRHRHTFCNDCEQLEAHLDQLQDEVAELLRRVPDPAATPATVTITVT